MKLWFLFSLFVKKRSFYEFSAKSLAKKVLKCSILVWNFGEAINVPRSNRWRHLLRRQDDVLILLHFWLPISCVLIVKMVFRLIF